VCTSLVLFPCRISILAGSQSHLFVHPLPGNSIPEGIDFTGAFVYQIKRAIISEFKHRFAGIDPDQLQLFTLDGSGCRTFLDPTQTLAGTGIVAGIKLEVLLTAATQAPLAGL
jgi:hypothetical protein